MKVNEIEERFPLYKIHGQWGDRVDVEKGYGAILEHITRDTAEMIVRDRSEMVSFVAEMAEVFERADPAAFSLFWYRDSLRAGAGKVHGS